MQIKTVIFDFGGVLADEGFREGLYAIALEQGLDPESFFKTADALIETTGYLTGTGGEADFWNALRQETRASGDDYILREKILSRFVLRPAMLEYVRKIRSLGLETVILSDQTDWLDLINERTPFFHHFDHVFNSFKMHKSKRDPSVFRDVAEYLGIHPQEAVFIDDNRNHIVRASEEHFRTVHFISIHDFAKDMERLFLHSSEKRLSHAMPKEKLAFFMTAIGLEQADMNMLARFKEVFTARKHEFADYFYDFFLAIPETGKILSQFVSPGFLKNVWASWIEHLFSGRLDDQFLGYLWRAGLRHVEVNLDQRFSNLGFTVARRFLQQITREEVPQQDAIAVSQTVDRLIDFCILVETNAYIDATSRCDLEIIKGVSDRIRNRITVIGGNMLKLRKKINKDDPLYQVYDSVISESMSCERMVSDIRSFIDMVERESEIHKASLEDLIKKALEKLRLEGLPVSIVPAIDLAENARVVLGDHRDLEMLFYYILQNGLEALDNENPVLSISSYVDPSLPNRIKIEVFNSGVPPRAEDIEKMYAPFYSTKPFGSGFGLPIARLAARKNYGKLALEPAEGRGTRVMITIPSPG